MKKTRFVPSVALAHFTDVAHYRRGLSSEDRDWLDCFVDAYSGRSEKARFLIAKNGSQVAGLCERVRETHAEKRDIMNLATRINADVSDISDKSRELPVSQSRSRYDEADYRPKPSPSEGLINDIIDATKLGLAKTFANYGDSPSVNVGDEVVICMSNHIYQDCVAVVLGQRRDEYLVKITSKTVPTGHGHSKPEQPVYGTMYVKAEAIKARAQLKTA
jgi:hypothetical protein